MSKCSQKVDEYFPFHYVHPPSLYTQSPCGKIAVIISRGILMETCIYVDENFQIGFVKVF